jgi:hypothetical protein
MPQKQMARTMRSVTPDHGSPVTTLASLAAADRVCRAGVWSRDIATLKENAASMWLDVLYTYSFAPCLPTRRSFLPTTRSCKECQSSSTDSRFCSLGTVERLVHNRQTETYSCKTIHAITLSYVRWRLRYISHDSPRPSVKIRHRDAERCLVPAQIEIFEETPDRVTHRP